MVDFGSRRSYQIKKILLKELLEDPSDTQDEDSIDFEDSFFNVSTDESSFESNHSSISLLEGVFSGRKRIAIKNYYLDVVPNYSDVEFIRHFRINRHVFEFLTNRFENNEAYIKLQKNRRVKSSDFHIIVFLWYAGHERCGFHDLSDRFDISISTAHEIIQRVTYFISKLSDEYIRWPDAAKMNETSRYFLSVKGYPDIIGKYTLYSGVLTSNIIF